MNALQIEERKLKIAQLRAEGMSIRAIAHSLGINRNAVTRHLSYIQARWRRQMAASYETMIIDELQKISLVEREFWQGWKRSVLDAVKRREVIAENKGEDSYQLTEERIVQSGDPRFLDGVMKCIERRCKLLGTDQPIKYEVDATLTKVVEMVVKTPEEVDSIPTIEELIASGRIGAGEN